MSLLKDISIESIRGLPESATGKNAISEIFLIEKTLEENEENFHKFQKLANKWKEETLLLSSTEEIESNPSYLEIICMGKSILPYIFQDLKSEPNFWFYALEKITGVNPIRPSHRGIIDLMTEDWLKWGEENGYI